MRNPKRAFLTGAGILAVGTLITLAIAAVDVVRFHGSRLVDITVTNTSARHIRWFKVVQEAHKGEVEGGQLFPGQSRTVRMPVKSESSYKVAVEFENGEHLVGGGLYVESGYRGSERVGEKAIDSRYAVIPL